MAMIATLIAKLGSNCLDTERVGNVATAIFASDVHWLSQNEAVDFVIDGATDDLDEVEYYAAMLRSIIGNHPIDFALQNPKTRRKKLLIADMDSTMIEQECIDELAEMAGVKQCVSDITRRAMNGEIAFEPALRERVALLKGLPVSIIQKVISERITFMPGGKTLVATMRNHGAFCALVSGGFTAFTGPIAAQLGFNANRANRLNEEDGLLSGTVAEPILGMQAKVDALEHYCVELGISSNEALAVGDGANDLGMIKRAGTGVALHAKPLVAAQAKIRIDQTDLTALLFIQGYSRKDFSTELANPSG
jgi:phosphoserine phosphatase